MCGRASSYTPPGRIAEIFDAEPAPGIEEDDGPMLSVGPTNNLLGLGIPAGPEHTDLTPERYRPIRPPPIPQSQDGTSTAGAVPDSARPYSPPQVVSTGRPPGLNPAGPGAISGGGRIRLAAPSASR
jgi:hypothetical protein